MRQVELKQLELFGEYYSLYEFAKENRLTYKEFDTSTINKINLFVMPKDEHFKDLETTLDKIIKGLPALKRLFIRPIIRLKDVSEILSVESVRIINNQSVSHASRHSELWGNIENGQLKPKKLMTIDKVEEYEIYENIAFARLVKIILAFVKKNMGLLKDVLYATEDMNVNFLERLHHEAYFLTLGKLHMGYSRGQKENKHAFERCMEKLLLIDNTLKAKLNSTVYRRCKKNKEKLTLKKTNVFRMHKDYKVVYNLLKWFSADKEISSDFAMSEIPEKGYHEFCNMLMVFSLGNFGFNFNMPDKMGFVNLKTSAVFKRWHITYKTFNDRVISGLKITFKKERTYTIGLVFSDDGDYSSEFLLDAKRRMECDECKIFTPTEYGNENCLYLSIFDIDSFRRVQQLILRGMIYSDLKKEVCPFCGSQLLGEEDKHVCENCRMEIYKDVCKETGKEFYYTKITEFSVKEQESLLTKDSFLFDKYVEAQMYFRNITPVDKNGRLICTHCKKIIDL